MTSSLEGGAGSPGLAGIFFAALLLASLSFSGGWAAQKGEFSARLVFEKSAGTGKGTVYVVKKGDSIEAIFRRQRGSEPVPYGLIRRLNPHIPDLNRIFPGQRIVIPPRRKQEGPAPLSESKPPEKKPSPYRVREGDSLSRIIIGELGFAPEEALTAYRLIRRLNPDLTDPTNIPAGSLINLPSPQGDTDKGKAVNEGDKPPALIHAATALLQEVVRRLGGTITAKGNYYLPLGGSSQLTVECAQIPVIELPDGSTILLDFEGRLSQEVRDLVRLYWSNLSFVPAEELRTPLSCLAGVIRRSINYRYSDQRSEISLLSSPEIKLLADAVIEGKGQTAGKSYRLCLNFLAQGEAPLPPEAIAFLGLGGVELLEISPEQKAITPARPPAPSPGSPRGLKGIALAGLILAAAGENPQKGVSVTIFDQARDGFNLSLTADLLVEKGGRKVLYLAKNPPAQFLRLLKGRGHEVVIISEGEKGKVLAEKALSPLSLRTSLVNHSLRIPQGGRPRLSISFQGLEVAGEGGPYLMLADESLADLLPLLQAYLKTPIVLY